MMANKHIKPSFDIINSNEAKFAHKIDEKNIPMQNFVSIFRGMLDLLLGMGIGAVT